MATNMALHLSRRLGSELTGSVTACERFRNEDGRLRVMTA